MAAVQHFDVALFTNLTRDHLDFHADMEQYFAAKRRLFEMLEPSAPGVINADDPRAASLAAACATSLTREGPRGGLLDFIRVIP